jgi:K+-transporting ATPase KdpF subunit
MEIDDGGLGRITWHGGLLSGLHRLRQGMWRAVTPWEAVLGGIIAAAMGAYLLYALLRAEKL